MTIDWILDNINFFGAGVDQTSILICLALVDTALGVSVKLYNHKPVHSQRFMAGVLHNFLPALIPALLDFFEKMNKHTLPIYQIVSVCLFLFVGYFVIESILANAVLLGLDVAPLKRWFSTRT